MVRKSTRRLFKHSIIAALDRRSRLEFPVLSNQQITKRVQLEIKGTVSNTVVSELLRDMRDDDEICFAVIGPRQYVYWNKDEQVIKRGRRWKMELIYGSEKEKKFFIGWE